MSSDICGLPGSCVSGKEDAAAAQEVAILRGLGLTKKSLVVDIGAGTGQFTLAAAPICARVIAVDVSPVMLDLLRDKLRRQGVSNVELVRAGFLTYEHAGEPADIVYSRYALHHYVAAVHDRDRRADRPLHPREVWRTWRAASADDTRVAQLVRRLRGRGRATERAGASRCARAPPRSTSSSRR
jgi:FkbM family methyltransferase